MPELPEVENWRRLAHDHLVGGVIRAVHVRPDPIVFEGQSPRRIVGCLAGRRVVGTGRKGKHLWLELDTAPWPVFHFGMTGSFRVYAHETERPTYLKLELLLEDGTRLGFRNLRRLGRVRLRENPLAEPPVSELGWDPLVSLPSTREISSALGGRRAPIKALLLDQTLFAGVGNWIADEVLYQARIRPTRRAHTLRPGEWGLLRARLGSVVKRAVAVNADSDRFPAGWLFHRRWGKNARATTADGHPLRFTTVGGRTSAWVPGIQR